MELFDKVKDFNIPYSSHESDLYIPVNKETTKLINEYEFKCNVTRFTSQIDKKQWFDLPFAYIPFWTNKINRGRENVYQKN